MFAESLSYKNGEKTYKNKKLIIFTLKPSRRKFTNKSESFPYFLCPNPYKYLLELYFSEPIECDIYLASARQMMNSVHFKKFDGIKIKRFNPFDPMVHCYHIQFKKTYKRCCRRLFKIFVVDKKNPDVVYLRSHPFEIYARRRPEEEEFWNRHMTTENEKGKKKDSQKISSNLFSTNNIQFNNFQNTMTNSSVPQMMYGYNYIFPSYQNRNLYNSQTTLSQNNLFLNQQIVRAPPPVKPIPCIKNQRSGGERVVDPCNSPQEDIAKGILKNHSAKNNKPMMLKKITEVFGSESNISFPGISYMNFVS